MDRGKASGLIRRAICLRPRHRQAVVSIGSLDSKAVVSIASLRLGIYCLVVSIDGLDSLAVVTIACLRGRAVEKKYEV